MSRRCIHCGATLGRLLSLALITDAGAEDPIKCSSRDDGGEHDIREVQL